MIPNYSSTEVCHGLEGAVYDGYRAAQRIHDRLHTRDGGVSRKFYAAAYGRG